MNPTLLDYITAAVSAKASGGAGSRPRSRTQGAPTSVTNDIWTDWDADNIPVGTYAPKGPGFVGNTINETQNVTNALQNYNPRIPIEYTALGPYKDTTAGGLALEDLLWLLNSPEVMKGGR